MIFFETVFVDHPDSRTISPKLIAELESTQGDLPRKLDPEKAKSMQIERMSIDEAKFEEMHKVDRMAHDKLKEGIEGFSEALENLEKLLSDRLTKLGAGEKEELAVR